MVIILVALTFFGVILVQAILHRLARKKEVSRTYLRRGWMELSPAVATSDLGRVPQFPEDFYYHMGHGWVKLEEGNRMKIGLDDFTQQVMGDIDGFEIPPAGSNLHQGETAWKVGHGKRKLSQLAPLGGMVVEVNENLKRDPALANRSPYEEGWVLKIQTKGLNKEMPALMDALQFKAQFDQDKAQLMSSFNDQTLGMVYGDGEAIIRGAANKMDESTWKTLVTRLFHSSSE